MGMLHMCCKLQQHFVWVAYELKFDCTTCCNFNLQHHWWLLGKTCNNACQPSMQHLCVAIKLQQSFSHTVLLSLTLQNPEGQKNRSKVSYHFSSHFLRDASHFSSNISHSSWDTSHFSRESPKHLVWHILHVRNWTYMNLHLWLTNIQTR